MRPAYWEIRAPGRQQCRRDELGRLLPRDDAVVLGRKFCAGCGHWRHVCDFGHLRGRGLRSRCRVCHNRESSRRYYAQTPEQMDRLREYWRFWQEAQRRKAGIPPTTARRRTAVDRVERIMLPREPLVAVINGHNLTELAERAGLEQRTVGRIVSGESARVRIDVADKLAVALGVPSALIWEEW